MTAVLRQLPRVLSAAVLTGALTLVPLLAPTAAHASDVVGGPRLGTNAIVVGAGAAALPKVSAESWLVADATTGQVLAAKAAHRKHRPASTLKTLTAATLMPHLDPGAEHLVTAQEQAPVYGSRAGIVAGATYTVDDLWHALLLPSGNDAAAALAATYGGVKKTVKAMNAEARRLQALDTTAVNPSGLDADGQYTSAYDLALIARSVLALPEFIAISGTQSYDLPGRAAKPGKTRSTFKIYGQNRMLNDGYGGVIAGKTGYTSLAGRTFWVAATRGGHTIIVTMLGIGEATETAAAALMTWGLRNAGNTAAVGTLVDPVPAGQQTAAPTGQPVAGGGVPGTTAAGAGAPAASSTGSSWLLGPLALAILLGGGWLYWRRRRTSSAGPEGGDPAPAPAAVPTARPATPVPAAAVIVPSVIVVPAVAPGASSAPEQTTVEAAEPSTAPAQADGPPTADSPQVSAPTRVRPASIAPTGNVTVVRPPTRDPGEITP